MAAAFVAGPDHAAHYATTGTGLNACQQSIQLAWLQQHQPERLVRAASALHCKDWLYFKLTGQRAVDPAEAIFTYGDFRTRSYAPAVSERLGIARHAHLLPDIVDGARTHHAMTPAAAADTGLPSGLPVVLGYVDVVCSAIGGGLYDPSGTVGCSIIGSTGMHMRMANGADAVSLNPACSGYTMALPGAGLYAQSQSNMAGTVNIDWLVELARQACAMAGIEFASPCASGRRRSPRGGRRSRQFAVPSLYPGGRRTWAVHECRRAGAVLGPVDKHQFRGPVPVDL